MICRSKWLSFLSIFKRGSATPSSNATPPNDDDKEKTVDAIKIEEYPSSPRIPRKSPPCVVTPQIANGSPQCGRDDKTDSSLSSDGQEEKRSGRKWPTRWYWQFGVLTVRTFRQSRHVLLSKIRFVETFLIAAIVSFVWFQTPHDEESITDRIGYVSAFFLPVCWYMYSICVC